MSIHLLAILSGASMIGLAVIGAYATRSDQPGAARHFGALALVGCCILVASVLSATHAAVLS